jgi:hypothetical protein
MHAGAGADIDHMVGLEDGVLVMLDDDHGVAEVAQMLQRLQKPGVVALMQADGGLVQDIEHARQPRADLRRQPDALALAAGQRAGITRQCQVIQPDIVEEFQPIADLLEDARGDLVLLGRKLRRKVAEPAIRFADRHLRDLGDVQPVDLHRQRLRLQPVAAAGLARMVGLIAAQLFAHPGGIGLLPAPLDIIDDAFERLGITVGPHAVVIGEGDGLAARAEQDAFLRSLGQFVPGRVHRHFVMLGQRFQCLVVIGRGRASARPRQDRALLQRQRRIGNDERGLELQLRAEAVAFRTGAERIVEREQPRLDFVDGEAGNRAGEALREDNALMRIVLRFVRALRCGRRQRLVGIFGDG